MLCYSAVIPQGSCKPEQAVLTRITGNMTVYYQTTISMLMFETNTTEVGFGYSSNGIGFLSSLIFLVSFFLSFFLFVFT